MTTKQFVLAIPAAILVIAFFASSAATGAEPDEPLTVLLLSGRNNHDWRKTTPVLESLLESTGRFEVDVNEQPHQLTAETLKPYDVILSNWNAWGKGNDDSKNWPDATRKAYLQFVRHGGGHVVVHAGSSSFADWPEYLQLTLATWKLGQTGHGPQHEFPVRIEKVDHPITKGLADFKIHDELWNRPGMQEGVTVLASSFSAKEYKGTGQYESTAMVDSFDKGRSFTLMLGHGPEQMKHPGFVALFVRGTEWAATGRVTVSIPDAKSQSDEE